MHLHKWRTTQSTERGRFSVAVFGDNFDLYHAHDAAHSGEEAQGENTDETDLLARGDFDLQKEWDRE